MLNFHFFWFSLSYLAFGLKYFNLDYASKHRRGKKCERRYCKNKLLLLAVSISGPHWVRRHVSKPFYELLIE